MYRKLQYAAMCLPVLLAAWLCQAQPPSLPAIPVTEVVSAEELAAMANSLQAQAPAPQEMAMIP